MLNQAVYAGISCDACHQQKLIERPHVEGDAFCYGCGQTFAVDAATLDRIRFVRQRHLDARAALDAARRAA